MGPPKKVTYQEQEFESFVSLAQHLGMSKDALFCLRIKVVPEEEWTDPKHRQEGGQKKRSITRGKASLQSLNLLSILEIKKMLLREGSGRADPKKSGAFPIKSLQLEISFTRE